MNLSDFVPSSSDVWGPSKIHHSHTFVPIEFVGRTEKLGRFCDFTMAGMRARRGDQEGDEFKFVDSRNAGMKPKKFGPRAAQFQFGGHRNGRQWGGRQGSSFAPRGNQKGGGQWGAVRIDHRTGKPVPIRPTHPSKSSSAAVKPYWQRGGPSNIVKGIRDWSTPIKPEYTLLADTALAQLGKRKIDAAKIDWYVSDANNIEYENLLTCGELCQYDKSFDKIPSRQPKPLVKAADSVNFYNVTTGQDPVMEELITRAIQSSETNEVKGYLVACTEQVLSALMTANRSMYSWDLVVTRNGNTILIDKRDSSPLDFASVSENAAPNDQPSFDENIDPMTQINSPVKLGIEATGINQNFSQQVLNTQACESMEYPNPFDDEEEGATAAKTAYMYRKAFIPAVSNGSGKDWNFIIRGEANAKLEDGKFVSLKTLNEFESKTTNWKESFEKGRDTAVFATEMKNNACKLARWLASATISGVEVLKIGFVSRKSEQDPWNHSLLAVQTHNVKDLMAQTALSNQTMWSAVCQLLQQILDDPNQVGKYLIVKDPSKPNIGLYQVPWDEFDEEEGDEEEEEEDEEEE